MCELCGQAFRQKAVLEKHQRVMHATGRDVRNLYSCLQCGYLASGKQSLNSHMRKHKDKPGGALQGSQDRAHLMTPGTAPVESHDRVSNSSQLVDSISPEGGRNETEENYSETLPRHHSFTTRYNQECHLSAGEEKAYTELNNTCNSEVLVAAPGSYLELVNQAAGGNTLYVPGQYPRVQVDLEWGSGAWGT